MGSHRVGALHYKFPDSHPDSEPLAGSRPVLRLSSSGTMSMAGPCWVAAPRGAAGAGLGGPLSRCGPRSEPRSPSQRKRTSVCQDREASEAAVAAGA